MSERDVNELVRMTRLPADLCRDALEQNHGDVGAAHRVLVIRKNKDRADASERSAALRARDAEQRALHHTERQRETKTNADD